MKRSVRLCDIGVGLHDVTHVHLAEPMKQGFLNRFPTDEPRVVVFLIHDRKDIQPIRRHPLPCFRHAGVDLDRFDRAGHDILGQQSRAILCGQQPNDPLFDLRKCLPFDRGGCRDGVASSSEFPSDPADIDFRLTAPPDHFHSISHPLHDTTTVEGSRFILSRTPAAITGPAPSYGADNDYVLRTILDYDDDKITELVATGALA